MEKRWPGRKDLQYKWLNKQFGKNHVSDLNGWEINRAIYLLSLNGIVGDATWEKLAKLKKGAGGAKETGKHGGGV
jgi:hypothetical protein